MGKFITICFVLGAVFSGLANACTPRTEIPDVPPLVEEVYQSEDVAESDPFVDYEEVEISEGDLAWLNPEIYPCGHGETRAYYKLGSGLIASRCVEER